MPAPQPRIVTALGGALVAALELVLPVSCAGCGRWDAALCADCHALLRAPPVRCDADVPMLDRDGAPILPTWTIGRYAGPLRTLVLAWKNHRRTDVAPAVRAAATAAARTWVPQLLEVMRTGAPTAPPTCLVVVPAPSGWRRRVRRRFVVGTLADAVGRGLAEGLGAAPDGPSPTIRRVLVVDALRRRPGRSSHQSGLGARGRSANRTGGVRVLTSLPAGAVAVLVDDVVTTGATLAACRDALVAGGATVAGALVVAATPAPPRRRVPGPMVPRPGPRTTPRA